MALTVRNNIADNKQDIPKALFWLIVNVDPEMNCTWSFHIHCSLKLWSCLFFVTVVVVVNVVINYSYLLNTLYSELQDKPVEISKCTYISDYAALFQIVWSEKILINTGILSGSGQIDKLERIKIWEIKCLATIFMKLRSFLHFYMRWSSNFTLRKTTGFMIPPCIPNFKCKSQRVPTSQTMPRFFKLFDLPKSLINTYTAAQEKYTNLSKYIFQRCRQPWNLRYVTVWSLLVKDTCLNVRLRVCFRLYEITVLQSKLSRQLRYNFLIG